MSLKLLQNLIKISITVTLCTAHICTDNWELVYKENGPVCWALLKATDFKAGFQTNSNICNSVEDGEVAVVRNSAQKAVLSDLANRVREPTLTCYKSTQESVEGQFKSVDYQEPPEYLKTLNEQGMVKLSRGIAKGDQITISFSMKIAMPEKIKTKYGKARALPSIIRISNSTNFVIQMECRTEDVSPNCVIKYENATKGESIQFLKTGMKKQLTVEYFGTATIDFLDHKINVWERFKPDNAILTPPSTLSYLGMDEIHVENVVVASVEHTKKCPGEEGGYGFETKVLEEEPMPKLHFRADTVPAPRMSLGSNHTFLVSKEPWMYYNGFDLVFDVRVSQKYKDQTYKNITIDFWSQTSHESIFKTILDPKRFVLERSGKPAEPIGSRVNSASVQTHTLVDFRFRISSPRTSDSMTVVVTLHDNSVGFIKSNHISMPLRNFDEIRLLSDSAIFYDVRMKSLRSVEITTCNFRNQESSDSVPYHPDCFKHRNILCQKKSEDLNEEEEIPDEPEEKLIWEEDKEIKGIGMNTTEEEEEPIEEIVKKKKKERIVVQAEEEEVEIQNFQGFQWSIIALTSVTAMAFAAIFSLNLVRCWL